MQSLSLIKDLEEEVEFSLFLSWAQMDHCVLGLTGTKGRCSEKYFRCYLWGPSRVDLLGVLFFTFSTVFCSCKGRMNSFLSQGISFDFLLAVEMKLAASNSSAVSQMICNPSSSFFIFDGVYHLKEKVKDKWKWEFGREWSSRFPSQSEISNSIKIFSEWL